MKLSQATWELVH